MKLFLASISFLTCCLGNPANAQTEYLIRTGPSMYGPGNSYNYGEYHDDPFQGVQPAIIDSNGNRYVCDGFGTCEAENY